MIGFSAILTTFFADKYNKYMKITNLVSTTQKARYLIIYHTLKLIMQTLWLGFIQYMNTSVRKKGRKTYVVSYTIEGRIYRLLLTPKRGPPPVLMIVSNEDDEEVTDELLPYMGPMYDWHGNTTLTPESLGYDEGITLHLSNGEEIVYEGPQHVEGIDLKLS
jgi:hypothetical protein